MAEPAFDNAATLLGHVADPLDHFQADADDGTTGWVQLAGVLKTALVGTAAHQLVARIDKTTKLVAAVLRVEQIRYLFEPIIRQMAISGDMARANVATFPELWRFVYDYCHENSKGVNSAEATFDPFAANGNLVSGGSIEGDGSVDRLSVDENGYDLAGWLIDTYDLTCTEDSTSEGVSKFRERFKLTGTRAHENRLVKDGSGVEVQRILPLTSQQAKRYQTNPAFTRYTGDITTLPGWRTATGATNFSNLSIDTTNTFRQEPGEQSAVAITFDANETLYTQTSESVTPKFNRNSPYTFRIWVRRNGSATGTVTLRISPTVGSGGVSASVSLASITADTWSELKIAIGTNSWPINFAEAGMLVQIAVTSLAVSTCNIASFIAGPMVRVGKGQSLVDGRGGMGQYVVIASGAAAWKVGDTLQAVDVAGTAAVVEEWLTLGQLGYLPGITGGSETIADR